MLFEVVAPQRFNEQARQGIEASKQSWPLHMIRRIEPETPIGSDELLLAFHEPRSLARRPPRPRPRLGCLSSRMRTSRRTVWFTVLIHAEERKGSSPRGTCGG